MGWPKKVMHCAICGILIFLASWIYWHDSPTAVFSLLIAWIYWNELKNSEEWKRLKSSQEFINDNSNITK